MRQRLIERQNPPSSGLRLLAHAQASRGGPRRHALRSIGCAARAYKASQDFARHAINSVRSGDDAIGRRRTRVTFRTGRPWRASWASGSLRSRRATFAAGSRRPLCPGLALRALRSDGARWARRTGSAALANGALWTDGSLRTLCTLRASRTDRPGRASFARRSGRTLRPRCRTATRHHNDGDGSRKRQQLSHRHSPAVNKTAPAHRPGSSGARTGAFGSKAAANVLLELAARDGAAKLPLINTRASGFRWWLSGRSFQRSALQSSSTR